MIGRTPRSSLLSALALASSLCGATSAAAGQADLGALKQGALHDRFIVRFDADAPERRTAAGRQGVLDGIGREHGLRIAQLRRLAVGADVVTTSRKLDRPAAAALMQRLARDPRIAHVEVDALAQATWTPNDPRLSEQWHYTATSGINALAAWDRADGTGVVVAVLDTGNTYHSDLHPNLVAGYDFISDAFVARDGGGRDNDPYDPGDWIEDGECGPLLADRYSSWHGTHVAGTIAALANNNVGVVGVAHRARVMPVRVLGRCGGYTSDIADAIVWASGGTWSGAPAASANPAEVINLSLSVDGACTAGSSIQLAIDDAVGRGTVVVAAAGNNAANTSLYTPASCAKVITVAAVHGNGGLAYYSNFGSQVDVAAPGGEGTGVLSTSNLGLYAPGGEAYDHRIGTSMAAPHVAGTVALMQGVHTNTPATVESILKSTVRPFSSGCATNCGTGIIDAYAAVMGTMPIANIGDAVVREGSAGTTLATFTIGLSSPAAEPVTFNVAFCKCTSGTATEGVDFDATTRVGVTIPAGQSSITVTVPVVADTVDEADEVFYAIIQSLANAHWGDSTAEGRIVNDDMTLTLANAPALAEGHGGEVNAAFVATLSKASSMPVTFTLSTANGTGTAANADYDAFSAVAASIPAGTTTKTFYVAVNGDTVVEGNESFLLNLAGAVGANVVDGQASGTILNDDGPTLSIGNVTLVEGHSGTKLATFTVALSQAASVPVTYNIAVEDDQATAASGDFVARTLSGETIAPGATSRTFAVTVNGDATAEENELFKVRLSGATGASIFDSLAYGTIYNDDGAVITIGDVSVVEGQSGQGLPSTKSVVFTLALSQAVATTTTCTAATANGTALAGSDYVAKSQTLTIPAGQTGVTFAVTVNTDLAVEANENFFVNLACPDSNAATMLDGRAVATITNDDLPPSLSIGDIRVTEGNSGTTSATFTATLSWATGTPVTFDARDGGNGTATVATGDIADLAASVTIPAGSTSKNFTVAVNGDTAVEPNEWFSVTLSNIAGATLADGYAKADLINDDGPTLSVTDASVIEGDSGTQTITFTVKLSQARPADETTFTIFTQDGTATLADADYVSKGITGETIAAGMLSKTFSVTVNGDAAIEANETILVRLANAGPGVTIADDSATGTILNNDGTYLTIGDVSVVEGDSGTRYMYLTVTRHGPTGEPIGLYIDYADGTALRSDNDWNPSIVGLTMPAAQVTNNQLSVVAYGDTKPEPNENFHVTLRVTSGNATVLDGASVVTILNDD